MPIGDKFDFLALTSLWKGIQKAVGTVANKDLSYKASENKTPLKTDTLKPEMANIAGNIFIKLAGLSGASAVLMGAYGSHVFYGRKDVPDELKEVYKIANYYHFLHTIALLAIPLVKRPLLVGSLITAGMTIFCGTCYVYAMTGEKSIRMFTPYGGTLLIVGWLSMLL